MRKKLLSRVMLLLVFLLTGAGHAWGAEETIELTYLNFTGTSYNTTENTFTQSDITFGYVNAMRNGSNGTPSGWAKEQVIQTKSGSSIYNKTAIKGLKQIRVYTVANTNSFTITSGTESEPKTNSVTRPTTATGTETITYSSYANKTTTSGQSTTSNYYDFEVSDEYFKIVPDGSLYIWKIVLTYDDLSSSLTPSDLALINAPIALSFDLYNNSTAQTISYTTSGTGAVTVDESDYVTTSVDATNKTITVTPKAVTPSAQTITVRQAADDTHAAGAATFTVSVADSRPVTTETITFSDKYSTNTTLTGITVEGTDFSVTFAKGSSGTEPQYYTTGNAVRVYGGSTFTVSSSTKTIEKIELTFASGGDNNEITTKEESYSNGTWTGSATSVVFTVGGTKGHRRISAIKVTFEAEVDDGTASIAVRPKTVDATCEETEGTIAVTYKNITDVLADVQFCDAEGETATYDWVEAEIDKDNNVYYTIEANTGEARTAYLRVYALDDDNSDDVYSDIITINQAKYVETTTYSLATSITSGKHYLIASSKGDGSAQAMGGQNTNNRAAVDVTVESGKISISEESVYPVVIYGPDAEGFYTIYDEEESGFLYAAGSGKGSNYLRTTDANDDNGRWTITFDETESNAVITAQGTNTNNLMRYNSSNKLFSCYGSGQNAIYLYEKVGETPAVSVSVTNAGYATFCNENALDFTGKGIAAYIATADGTTGVNFAQVNKVPANTGVLLYADGGATLDIPTLTGAADATTDNVFVAATTEIASLASTEGNKANYILNNVDGNVGFYPANGKKVATGKAYIQISAGNGVKGFIGLPGSDETGIATVESSVPDGTIYTLSGQRVQKPVRGLYIVNGKKVWVK